jgi:hypothetical protein
MNLELYSNDELIAELLNRDLFVGFLVQSKQEAKEQITKHTDFDLKISKTLNMPQTLTLMETCANELRRKGYVGVKDGTA